MGVGGRGMGGWGENRWRLGTFFSLLLLATILLLFICIFFCFFLSSFTPILYSSEVDRLFK